MTIGRGQGAGPAAEAAEDWRAVRAAADLQYTPLPEPKAPPTPDVPWWLRALGRLLEAIFEPIGRLLGLSWPVFQYVLLGLAVLLALFLLWRLVLEPLLEARRNRRPAQEVHWVPSRAEAEVLLEDADRLAAQGRYGEAAQLLLHRSVRQISEARPEWLTAASTAREIAALPMLPTAGRRAFGVIAGRVERAIFALRPLDAQDWQAARGAYAEFAQIALRA
ncbi:hypothetical protein [Novosphingobium soli]|uniref:hypothetical protein n=1 Tax=Novosphingobium soli TaxID=574956 RepID=UPI0036D242C5